MAAPYKPHQLNSTEMFERMMELERELTELQYENRILRAPLVSWRNLVEELQWQNKRLKIRVKYGY